MKKILSLTGVILMLIFFSACSGEPGKINNFNTGYVTISENTGIEPSGKNEDKDTETKKRHLEIGVIAKSGSAVSSDDKEKVISELGDKLDSLFESINESKDTDQSVK